MISPSRIAVVVIFMGLAIASAAQSSAIATVEGEVLDRHGLGVASAKIVIFPMERGVSGPLPSTTTDSKGRFVLKTPPFGKTRFCAVKESEGYPNTQLLLFS